jgi:hypothetical protein
MKLMMMGRLRIYPISNVLELKSTYLYKGVMGFMVFKATFNNISVLSWRTISLVEEIGVPAENQRPVTRHCQHLSHDVVSVTPRLSGVRTHNVSGDRH